MAPLKRSKAQAGGQQKRQKLQSQDKKQPIVTGQNRLLELPAELRNEIYDYVFAGQTLEIGNDGKVPSKPFALLRTCRQIYHEARLIPHIKFTYSAASERDFKAWLKDMQPDQRDAITSLSFRIEPSKINPAALYYGRRPHIHQPRWHADEAEGIPPWLLHPVINLRHLQGLKHLYVRGTYYFYPVSVNDSLREMKKLVNRLIPGLEITIEGQFGEETPYHSTVFTVPDEDKSSTSHNDRKT